MRSLTEEEVAAVGRAAGLPIIPSDLPEVTVRVNTFIEGVAALDELELASVQPIPAAPHPERLP